MEKSQELEQPIVVEIKPFIGGVPVTGLIYPVPIGGAGTLNVECDPIDPSDREKVDFKTHKILQPMIISANLVLEPNADDKKIKKHLRVSSEYRRNTFIAVPEIIEETDENGNTVRRIEYKMWLTSKGSKQPDTLNVDREDIDTLIIRIKNSEIMTTKAA